jgi:hypothetical protein
LRWKKTHIYTYAHHVNEASTFFFHPSPTMYSILTLFADLEPITTGGF